MNKARKTQRSAKTIVSIYAEFVKSTGTTGTLFVTKFTPFWHNFYKIKFKNSRSLEITPHRIKKDTWENNLNSAIPGIDKSSQRRCSLKKDVLKKVAGKHLCPSSLFFYKVAGFRLVTVKQSRLPYVWHFNEHWALKD